jgi:hypothetical protein
MIHVIIDKLDDKPILTASSEKKATELLDEWMGVGSDPSSKSLGFVRYVYSEHEDPYIGTYTYECVYGGDDFISIVSFDLYGLDLDI